MNYDSTIDTTLHINRVRFLLGQCAIVLLERGSRHDASKLEEPEKEIFDVVGNRLAVVTYAGEKRPESGIQGAWTLFARLKSAATGFLWANSLKRF
jgi:hypothetical protein